MILHVAIPTPLRKGFDYLPPEGCDTARLLPGVRLRVPFGRQVVVGVLIHCVADTEVPSHKMKRAIELLDEVPLWPASMLPLLEWVSRYYQASKGEVWVELLPRWFRTGKRVVDVSAESQESPRAGQGQTLVLNEEQRSAVAAIQRVLGTYQTFLLPGVTGSGKTEVYMEVIESVVQQQGQALVLVPEIHLTPQMLKRFTDRFQSAIGVLHSGVSVKKRAMVWSQVKDGSIPIVIGTRSAVFVPMKNLKLIIVDEEHDASFKQQEGFRYHARDVAVKRAQLENIPIVLGSATPSLESINNVECKRYTKLILPNRVGSAGEPTYRLVDIRNQKLCAGLSPLLFDAIQSHLNNKGQVLLFLNRRGYAPSWICHQCGWVASCEHCDAYYTYHHSARHLRCHHCDAVCEVIQRCPSCHGEQMVGVGVGTEKIEHVLSERFPTYPLVRIDRDSTRRKGSMDVIREAVLRGDPQLLIGTQMLAKGHHFPDVTLVAIVNADNGLLSSEFRALEQTAQLLIQVAGRAGRAEKPGEVIIQTHHPHHPLLLSLIHRGYTAFAKQALQERKQYGLPPHVSMAVIRAESRVEKAPGEFLGIIQQQAMALKRPGIRIFGPIPALMTKKAGQYRSQLLFESEKRAALQQILKELLLEVESRKAPPRVRWALDIDPISVL